MEITLYSYNGNIKPIILGTSNEDDNKIDEKMIKSILKTSHVEKRDLGNNFIYIDLISRNQYNVNATKEWELFYGSNSYISGNALIISKELIK